MSYQFDNQDFAVIVDYTRPPRRQGEAFPTARGILCKLEPGARMPQRANPTDAGADLFCWFHPDSPEDTYTINPGEQRMIDTGVSVQIPKNYAGFIHMRSSQRKSGLTGWGTGIIDSDYRGTLRIIIKNHGDDQYIIDRNTKIAQLVIQPVELVEFVDYWNNTNRGTGGFGSTGK